MKVGIVGGGIVGATARLRDSARVIRQALDELGEPLTNSHLPGQARGPAMPAREAICL